MSIVWLTLDSFTVNTATANFSVACGDGVGSIYYKLSSENNSESDIYNSGIEVPINNFTASISSMEK